MFSALSATVYSMSAAKPFNVAPSAAFTGPSDTVTTSTPSTFSTLSVAEIRAAAVSVIS